MDPRIARLKKGNPYLGLEDLLLMRQQEEARKALEEQLMMQENMGRGSGAKIGTIEVDGEILPYTPVGPAREEVENPEVLRRERLRNSLKR